jgi:hypothetical protein
MAEDLRGYDDTWWITLLLRSLKAELHCVSQPCIHDLPALWGPVVYKSTKIQIRPEVVARGGRRGFWYGRQEGVVWSVVYTTAVFEDARSRDSVGEKTHTRVLHESMGHAARRITVARTAVRGHTLSLR